VCLDIHPLTLIEALEYAKKYNKHYIDNGELAISQIREYSDLQIEIRNGARR
jgi:hypothetical protein